MSLYQFMSEHRGEILQVCRKKLREDVMPDGNLDRDVEIFFDEIIAALRQHQGLGGVLANNLVRMETLVARTLGTAQLESQVELELFPVRVASVLRHLQASAIPHRAISITLEVDESLYVNADEMLLTSALSNLLQNAIKFSRAGACVTLSCSANEAGVVIEVEDECGGLPPGEPTELLFPRVHGAEPPMNLRLGLAISRRAVEAMSGEVRVENHPGSGCSVKLVFPLAVPTRRSSPPPPSPT